MKTWVPPQFDIIIVPIRMVFYTYILYLEVALWYYGITEKDLRSIDMRPLPGDAIEQPDKTGGRL
jgi:hypothetical protein